MPRARTLGPIVLVLACGNATNAPPHVPPTTPTATGAKTADACAVADPLAAANALEAEGRTRRALRAIRSLPAECLARADVAARAAALQASLVVPPSPPGDPMELQTTAASELAKGDAALLANREADAKVAWEKSWATWHPNGAALARLGAIAKRANPIEARRLFERAATELGEIAVDATDVAPPEAIAWGADAKWIAAGSKKTVTIVLDAVPRAVFPVKNPPRAVTFGASGDVTIDDGVDVSRWDVATGRALSSTKAEWESVSGSSAVKRTDDGYTVYDATTKARIADLSIKGARPLYAVASGGVHLFLVPEAVEKVSVEERTIQVHDDVGTHPRKAPITTHRSTNTLVHATLKNGKLVRHTLSFGACVQSDGPLSNPHFFSYSGINEHDRCDGAVRATVSEDGSLAVIDRAIASGGVHMTSALTITDFGPKNAELVAPEDKQTDAVALSKDGALLAWQFGFGVTRVYATKTMKLLWETDGIAAATDARFSPDGSRIAFATTTGVVVVDATTGKEIWSLHARVPRPVTALTGSAGTLALAFIGEIAFVGADGIGYATAPQPIDFLRLAPRGDRVVAPAPGRPTLVIARSGFVAKLAPTSVRDAAFSPDGSKVVLAQGTELRTYDPTTGAVDPPLAKTRNDLAAVAWSKDRLVAGSADELTSIDPTSKAATSLHLGSTIVRLAFGSDGVSLFALTQDHAKSRVFAYDAAHAERYNVELDKSASDLVALPGRLFASTAADVRALDPKNGAAAAPMATKEPLLAATATRLAVREGTTIRLVGPAGENPMTLVMLPDHRAVISGGGSTEVINGGAMCRAGTLLLPIEVCDGLLVEGTIPAALGIVPAAK